MSKARLRTKIIASLLLCFSVLALVEISLRLLGFKGHEPVLTQVRSIPENALLPSAQYGLALNPGNYTVRINENLQYRATHLADSTRACGAQREDAGEILIYGCSLTYGMGVNDEETYPSLLQKAYPQYQVKNFATPGYGTIQSLLQLQYYLQNGAQPEMVILGYSSLHDARNMLTGIQQKYWSETLSTAVHPTISKAKFPYAEWKDERLKISHKPVSNFSRPWAISRYSAFIYRLEIMLSNIWYGFNDKYKLSEKIVLEMQRICTQRNIPFLIIGLDKSASLSKMKAFAAAREIPFLDAGIDLYDPRLNLQPNDAHPNSKAHQFYADQLINFLSPYFNSKLSMLTR